MTKSEYLKRRTEFERRDIWRGTWQLVIFFGLLLLFIPIDSYIPPQYSTIAVVVLMVFLIAWCVLIIWSGRVAIRTSGLGCRSCKVPLLGVQGDIAVATGKCSHCGHEAFHLGPNQPLKPTPSARLD